MGQKYIVIHQSDSALAVIQTVPILLGLKKKYPHFKILIITSNLMCSLMNDMTVCDLVQPVPKTLKHWIKLYNFFLNNNCLCFINLSYPPRWIDYIFNFLITAKGIIAAKLALICIIGLMFC